MEFKDGNEFILSEYLRLRDYEEEYRHRVHELELEVATLSGKTVDEEEQLSMATIPELGIAYRINTRSVWRIRDLHTKEELQEALENEDKLEWLLKNGCEEYSNKGIIQIDEIIYRTKYSFYGQHIVNTFYRHNGKLQANAYTVIEDLDSGDDLDGAVVFEKDKDKLYGILREVAIDNIKRALKELIAKEQSDE